MKRDRDEAKLCFTSMPTDALHPTLARHLASNTAQTTQFLKEYDSYTYKRGGAMIRCGGLKTFLKWRYYPKYKDNRTKRRWKTVQIKGSTKKQGKLVDAQIAASIEGPIKAVHPMTARLLAYWKSIGHTLQAAQVPVEILDGLPHLTQADLITLEVNTGKLWLWELKTGFPVGFSRKQGTFSSRLSKIDCTKLGIWHLQLHYMLMAFAKANVEISEARVIQIYEHKKKGLVIKVHEQPEWIRLIPPL